MGSDQAKWLILRKGAWGQSYIIHFTEMVNRDRVWMWHGGFLLIGNTTGPRIQFLGIFGIFSRVDTSVFEQLWRTLRRIHQNKSKGWLNRKYWTASGRKHVFSVIQSYKGKKHLLKVVRIGSIGIRRHIKVKAEANPYLPEYARHFWRRRDDKEARLLGALSARAYRALRA